MRPASEISAGDIIRASEGGTAPVACLESDFGVCPRADVCETLEFWKGLDDVIDAYLDSVSLSELAARSLVAREHAQAAIGACAPERRTRPVRGGAQ